MEVDASVASAWASQQTWIRLTREVVQAVVNPFKESNLLEITDTLSRVSP
jgi:hypothetical protein